MRQWIGKTWLKLHGWTLDGSIPDDLRKCVVIEAPHTSMMDFIIGLMFFWSVKRSAKFLIKKELFSIPILGWILRKCGGIPVNRKSSNHLVEDVVKAIQTHDDICVVITPEGTRKRVERWKRGFYFIAQKAQVPVVMGFIDYKTKHCGYGPVFTPSGNYEEDWKIIEAFYRGIGARYPEDYNLS